jgi:hypothetical protein
MVSSSCRPAQKFEWRGKLLRNHIAERGIALLLALVANAVFLAEIFDRDDDVAHLLKC